jgi:hypothetical protein
LLLQAYAYPSLRADGPSCRHDQRSVSGTSAMISTATMLWRNCLDHARMGAILSEITSAACGLEPINADSLWGGGIAPV